MTLTWDEAKRQATLSERGLDFADASAVIDGIKFQFVDDRNDYGETRITTIGLLANRMVVVIWTRGGEDRHIISMRKANDREYKRYQGRLD
ncbi:MAG: BrnT family toxin [Sandarakinorhabdus sp.]|nr:BrnT family toxin [Sandarakinorhabdus sp.]